MAMVEIEWDMYYKSVLSDYRELKECYPFCCLSIFPTIKPEPAVIRVVAANKDLIEMTSAVESDFTGDYSRELRIVVPVDYRERGCKVYGAKWVDSEILDDEDIHFYCQEQLLLYGYELCVGTPESFPLMRNVILENVKTAENMLIAYERVMTGDSDRLQLLAYAHDDKGRKQFMNNKNKYLPRG